jgi:quercetin dioxygenase-like cupin family protein
LLGFSGSSVRQICSSLAGKDKIVTEIFEIQSIRDFSALIYEDKHSLARKALVHQTENVQINIYVLKPGGRIPAHQHTNSWDISVVIEGEIEVRFCSEGETLRCKRQAINLVPPGTVHEISNPSNTDSATFLLIQSPSRSFDFVRTALPVAS